MAGLRTKLLGGTAVPVEVLQLAVGLALERRLGPRWTFQASAAELVWGELGQGDERFLLGPGFAGSVAASFLALEQGKAWPFISLSGSLAVSAARSVPTAYVAVDLRLGAAVGYTFAERFTPYAAVRLFGGPVFWGGAVFGDAYHVQAGLGTVLGLPGGWDLALEVVPLGEQRATLGVGVSF